MSPTYKNCNKTRKEVNGKVVEPNEKLVSFQFLNEDDCELVQTDSSPVYNPTLVSVKIEKDAEIQVPKFDVFNEWVSKYNIHFYVEKGSVEIYYNNKSNSPPLKLYNQGKWNVRCLTRIIDKLYIKGIEEFVLWIEIERLM